MGPVEITGKACASTQKNRHRNVKELDWKALYGLGKGLWKEDAQEYVNRLRENRQLPSPRFSLCHISVCL